MGIGDEIMSLGRAEALYEKTGKPVGIRDKNNSPRVHYLWEGNPAWSKHSEQFIIDGPGARPYIKRWDGQKIIFNMAYRPRAGKIALDPDVQYEDRYGGMYIVISPHVKPNASPNKDYGFERWARAIKGIGLPVLQLGEGDQEILPGAKFVYTQDMRAAAEVVAGAALVMTNEGGLHHVAASMGTPAVVVHGGFTPPKVTGYSHHINLTGNTGHTGCGDWNPCDACRLALDKITPSMIKEAALGVLYASKKT